MKIAHFSRFAPRSCGQYETVKDLIVAERMVGLDARLIDCGTDDKGTVREGLKDGVIVTQPLAWADEADVYVRHTSLPDGYMRKKPLLLALHGRPENSFRLELYDKSPVISSVMSSCAKKFYSAVFTFWPEIAFHWKWITGEDVQVVPALVNHNQYKPEGPKHDFGNFRAEVNLVVADMWREDRTPFNLIFAAQYFKEHYHNDTKLHIYAAPVKEKALKFLASMQRNGVVGEVGGVVGNIASIYRGADAVLTPNIIATRIIREAMACGTPVVAPSGCKYTDFTADPRDYKAFAKAVHNCLLAKQESESVSDMAKKLFSMEEAGNAMKELCFKATDSKGIPLRDILFNAMSITKDDWDVLKWHIKDAGIQQVAEFGAGLSTKLMDSIGVKVTSYETQPRVIESQSIAVPSAKIVPWDGKATVRLNGADMVLIDGPHRGVNREPSYKSAFESNASFVACHDVHRPEDRVWLDKYFGDWKPVIGTNHLLILKRPEGI